MLHARSHFAPTIEAATSGGGDAAVGPKRTGGLVLARHADQSLMIGDEVAVEVVEVRAGAIRLRVVAPREVPVHRREVFDAIRSAPRAESDRPGPPSNRAGGGGGLVLTRHAEQSLMIGDSIEVTVVAMKGGTVRLRITAPREVPVHRQEVYDAIRA